MHDSIGRQVVSFANTDAVCGHRFSVVEGGIDVDTHGIIVGTVKCTKKCIGGTENASKK